MKEKKPDAGDEKDTEEDSSAESSDDGTAPCPSPLSNLRCWFAKKQKIRKAASRVKAAFDLLQ